MKLAIALFFGIAAVAACSSSSSSGGSGNSASNDGGTTTAASLLPNDSQTKCLTPSTTAQDFPLPATGGVTGTLSVGAYAAGVTGCLGIKVTTGDTLTPASYSPLALYTRDQTSTPKPIMQIDVGAAFGSDPVFGTASIVTGMSLNAPAVNFPDGTYYMTITKETTEGTRVQTITLTAANGVLTVAPLGTNAISGTNNQNAQVPQIVLANSTATLKLYARGVIPPDPSDSLSTTPTTWNVADGGLPPLPPGPLPTLPASAGMVKGLPPPTPGTTIGNASAYFPEPGCQNNPGCMFVHPIESQGGGTTPIDAVAGMYGTVTFDMGINYMQIKQADIDCPSDWDVEAGLDGSGAISIPESDPFTAYDTCTINYSTVTAADEGYTGYEFTVGLRGIDIGDHN